MFKSWMFNPVSPQELQTSNLFSTLAVSGSVAGGLDQCGEQVVGGMGRGRWRGRGWPIPGGPEVRAHHGKDITEGGFAFGIPGRLAGRKVMGVGPEHDEAEQAEQAGVVRPMAGVFEWRWVSRPRCARASGKVTSIDQRPRYQARLCSAETAGSVRKRATGSRGLGWRTSIQRRGRGSSPSRCQSAVPVSPDGGALGQAQGSRTTSIPPNQCTPSLVTTCPICARAAS
jgi:hypothetical protein